MQAILESQANEIFEHLVAGDEVSCRQHIDRVLRDDSVSVLDVCEQLADAFHAIGNAWACSEVSVYREHVASQIGYRLLLDLRTRLPKVSNDAPVAIGCTPEGDPYSLPTLMVELVLQELGWKATSLGSDLPLELLGPAVEEMKPRICWVSVSFVESPERLRQQLEFLVGLNRPRDFQVLCGGQALTDDMKEKHSHVAFADTLRDLQSFVDGEC